MTAESDTCTPDPANLVTGPGPRPEEPPALGTTLADVLGLLGPQVLHCACTPCGVEGTVSEAVIHDAGEPVPDQPDGILLAVGGSPELAQTLDAIRQAGAARYRAVVVKARGQDFTAAARAAKAARVALLIAPDSVPWRHIDALVSAATNAAVPGRASYPPVGDNDLFALANAIAHSVGGATTIEDPRGRILAHSNLPHQHIDEIRRQGILSRRTPDRPTNVAEYGRVCQAKGSVRFTTTLPGHLDRLAIAIRAGTQLLGLLWVCDGAPALGPGAEAALDEAARITALHLLRTRDHRNTDRWSRSEVLSSLLQGTVSGQVAAGQLHMDMGIQAAVLAIAPATRPSGGGVDGTRIVELVGLYCQAWHPQALCTALGDVVYALIPVIGDQAPGLRLLNFANEIAGAVQRSTSVIVHVGIGGPVDGLAELPLGRKCADRVRLALADAADRIAVATVEQVRSRIVLLELAEHRATTTGLLAGPVQQIIDHDQQHSTTYATTLLAYLDVFGEAARAAAAVSVHENTLRYRIRRVQEMFGLDLSDAETRLVTWLQLRLLHLGP
jgi:hypothetical protein